MPDMKEANINVTPLIDIVMCLIIFYMLVARIGVSTGEDPAIKPPITRTGSTIENIGHALTINVTGAAHDPVTGREMASVEVQDPSDNKFKTFAVYSYGVGEPKNEDTKNFSDLLLKAKKDDKSFKLIVRADPLQKCNLVFMAMQVAAEACKPESYYFVAGKPNH
jgi:hypothetical protein